jgi:hypothetical protein
MKIIKLTALSLSFLSVSLVSFKLVEIHLHFNSPIRAAAASTGNSAVATPDPQPLLLSKPISKILVKENLWKIIIPNNGEWVDVGMTTPSTGGLMFDRIDTHENLGNVDIKIGQNIYEEKFGATVSHYFHHLAEPAPIQLRSRRMPADGSVSLYVIFTGTPQLKS